MICRSPANNKKRILNYLYQYVLENGHLPLRDQVVKNVPGVTYASYQPYSRCEVFICSDGKDVKLGIEDIDDISKEAMKERRK